MTPSIRAIAVRWRQLLLLATLAAGSCLLLLMMNGSRPGNMLQTGVYLYRPLGCSCFRLVNRTQNAVDSSEATSSCGPTADIRGPNQKVISYSLFGNNPKGYQPGIVLNAQLVPKFYPGWTMRVYHDRDPNSTEWRVTECDILCRYDHVDLCDVRRLPGHGDVSRKLGSVWRFAVLGDATVDQFIVRDLDSLLGQRERVAVQAWIDSNLTFHVMRDHPYHGVAILAGMWGGWNWHNDLYRPILRTILDESPNNKTKSWDQTVLARRLWPEMVRRQDVLVHDSYTCRRFPLSRPWPSRRRNRQDFVGSARLRVNVTLPKECPIECRPAQHQDWRWC